MDQMLVLTVLYSHALQHGNRSRKWHDEFYRRFDDGLIARLLQPLR